MEWVETTGRTVDEAKEAALDELGVDETDAEFDVVAEPGIGLFGRLRSEARVRARVRPTAPRAKEDRRDRRRRERGSKSGTSAESPSSTETAGESDPAAGSAAGMKPERVPEMAAPASSRRDDRRPPAGRQRTAESRNNGRREGTQVEVALEEQGRIAEEFLRQLATEFGVAASISLTQPSEDTVDLQMEGADLGLLIGPKGATLLAIQDLTRTVVHNRTGANNGRIHVDIGGYRQRRAEALARFAVQVATAVQQSGARTALEPMSAADRKVVHDAITDIDGVSTVSEGEDPHRRVVVLPAGS
jgi:spoIIIJ-associated protein